MKKRKGYAGEYKAKQELTEQFGKEQVVKMAIAQQGADFLVIVKGILTLIVEVKETTSIKYRAGAREKNQEDRIAKFAELHHCEAKLWIYYRRGKGHITGKEVRDIN